MPATTPAAPASPPNQPRKRVARGPARPQYLQAEDVDKLFHVVIALMSEVSSLRDRLDTHELLAAEGRVATREAVEARALSAGERTAREAARQAMLKRTLRILTEEAKSAGEHVAGRVSAKEYADAHFDPPAV